jgi:hypothetical protein
MSLSDKILARNKAFEDSTNKILSEYKDKLDKVLVGLNPNLKEATVDWKHLNFSDKENSQVTIHGFTKVPHGAKIFDSDVGRMVTVNESNADIYLNYIRIGVSVSTLENESVDGIIKNIKELQQSDNKMTEAEFNKMSPPTARKH